MAAVIHVLTPHDGLVCACPPCVRVLEDEAWSRLEREAFAPPRAEEPDPDVKRFVDQVRSVHAEAESIARRSGRSAEDGLTERELADLLRIVRGWTG